MDFTLVAFLAVILVVPVFGLADAASRSPRTFRRAGRRKAVWVAAQLLVPVLGTLAYYAFVRPRLRARDYWDDSS